MSIWLVYYIPSYLNPCNSFVWWTDLNILPKILIHIHKRYQDTSLNYAKP